MPACVRFDGVHDGSCGEMHRAFLGPDPTQLAVAHETSPERAHVGEEVVRVPAQHEGSQGVDAGHDHFGVAGPPGRSRKRRTGSW